MPFHSASLRPVNCLPEAAVGAVHLLICVVLVCSQREQREGKQPRHSR